MQYEVVPVDSGPHFRSGGKANSSYIQFNLTKHIQYTVPSIQYGSTSSLAIHGYIYEIYGSKYLWPTLVTNDNLTNK